jgi:hypothetical protein
MTADATANTIRAQRLRAVASTPISEVQHPVNEVQFDDRDHLSVVGEPCSRADPYSSTLHRGTSKTVEGRSGSCKSTPIPGGGPGGQIPVLESPWPANGSYCGDAFCR